MKNLIKKILKEEIDDLDWVRGLDVDAAEREIKKPWNDIDRDYSTDVLPLFDMLVEFGIHEPSTLKDIGHELYGYFDVAYESGRDVGYDSGRDSCDCDGCCDDYYSYDYVQEQRDEGYDEGYDEGRDYGYDEGLSYAKSEAEDEIESLKNEISDLQSRIEDLENEG